MQITRQIEKNHRNMFQNNIDRKKLRFYGFDKKVSTFGWKREGPK